MKANSSGHCCSPYLNFLIVQTSLRSLSRASGGKADPASTQHMGIIGYARTKIEDEDYSAKQAMSSTAQALSRACARTVEGRDEVYGRVMKAG